MIAAQQVNLLASSEAINMANVAKRPDGSWRARYRHAAGREHSRHFDRKIDATRWLTDVESSKLVGSYLDPALGRVTVGEWTATWMDGQAHLKPSTRERYAGVVREHVEPRWGAVRLADVTHSAVQAWVSELATRCSPATTPTPGLGSGSWRRFASAGSTCCAGGRWSSSR